MPSMRPETRTYVRWMNEMGYSIEGIYLKFMRFVVRSKRLA